MTAVRRMFQATLTICAAGYGVATHSRLPLVCGLPPGHDGPHRDVEYTLQWSDQ